MAIAQALSFKAFQRLAPHVLRTRKPIMGHGRHGIGKSMVVYQLAPDLATILGLTTDKAFVKKWGKNYIYPIVERRASQMADTGDVIGVPEPIDGDNGRETTFAAMGWFLKACNEPCILFFDEVDRANNDVRQSLMELTDSRKIAGFTLHPDTVIVAMVNGGAHDTNNSYQVGELDPAEHDRWWHVDLEPTVEDWLTWAKDRVMPLTYDFYKQNPEHLEYKGDHEPNKVYPSRRSAAQFDKCLQDAAEAGDDLMVPGANGKLGMDVVFLGNGFIGQEASLAFKDFADNYNKQVTVENVLAGEKMEIVKKFAVNESNALIDKVAASKQIKNGLTKGEAKNLALFIHGIQAELAMKAWEKLTNVNPGVVKLLWATEVAPGQNFGGYIAQIVGEDAE